MNTPTSMNRRNLLAALGMVPVAAVPAVASASPSFEYGTKPHAPLTLAEKAAIDGMSFEDLLIGFRRPWAKARINSFFGRCNAAYTLATGDDGISVDAELVRSLLPRINEGHRADIEGFTTPAMKYGLSRLDIEAGAIAPLEAVDFLVDGSGITTRSQFQFRIPLYDKMVTHVPMIITSGVRAA